MRARGPATRGDGPVPSLAVTLGDPRGIGPEVALAAARTFHSERADVPLLLVGPDSMRPDEVRAPMHYRPVGAFDGSERSAGGVAAGAVREAVRAALEGEVSGIVTGPIHKPSLRAAGLPHPGHTELLQEWTGARTVGMLMAAETTSLGGPLRILLATTHLPLREVPSRLTPELLTRQTLLLHRSLREGWRIPEPRIALCALNPHASDEGLFGDEEERVYGPALDRLAAEGVRAAGPIPADTVFVRTLSDEFDAVVAPYHDVGMAAFKTASFGSGVNVTLGLPFVRTSPDHGTAFDLAGKGVADHGSMLEALRLAVRLAENA